MAAFFLICFDFGLILNLFLLARTKTPLSFILCEKRRIKVCDDSPCCLLISIDITSWNLKLETCLPRWLLQQTAWGNLKPEFLMRFHVSRFRLHASRFTFHASCFTFHVPWTPLEVFGRKNLYKFFLLSNNGVKSKKQSLFEISRKLYKDRLLTGWDIMN